MGAQQQRQQVQLGSSLGETLLEPYPLFEHLLHPVLLPTGLGQQQRGQAAVGTAKQAYMLGLECSAAAAAANLLQQQPASSGPNPPQGGQGEQLQQQGQQQWEGAIDVEGWLPLLMQPAAPAGTSTFSPDVQLQAGSSLPGLPPRPGNPPAAGLPELLAQQQQQQQGVSAILQGANPWHQEQQQPPHVGAAAAGLGNNGMFLQAVPGQTGLLQQGDVARNPALNHQQGAPSLQQLQQMMGMEAAAGGAPMSAAATAAAAAAPGYTTGSLPSAAAPWQQHQQDGNGSWDRLLSMGEAEQQRMDAEGLQVGVYINSMQPALCRLRDPPCIAGSCAPLPALLLFQQLHQQCSVALHTNHSMLKQAPAVQEASEAGAAAGAGANTDGAAAAPWPHNWMPQQQALPQQVPGASDPAQPQLVGSADAAGPGSFAASLDEQQQWQQGMPDVSAAASSELHLLALLQQLQAERDAARTQLLQEQLHNELKRLVVSGVHWACLHARHACRKQDAAAQSHCLPCRIACTGAHSCALLPVQTQLGGRRRVLLSLQNNALQMLI
jgi:hypothetical protein